MDFKEVNFCGTQMPIIIAEKGTMEYNCCYCSFNIELPFNQEDYDKIQKVPYIIYFPQDKQYITVEYHEGVEIETSINAIPKMIIHGAEGYITKELVNDPKLYNYNDKYLKELLSDADILRPWDYKEKEKDKENDDWCISWDTGEENQESIIDWSCRATISW